MNTGFTGKFIIIRRVKAMLISISVHSLGNSLQPSYPKNGVPEVNALEVTLT